MSDILVYAAAPRAPVANTLLTAACEATGAGVRLEVFGTGAMYQRLGPRRGPPFPDIVMWFGPYAARAAALDGLLQPHRPAHVADTAPHDPDWKWTSLDFSPIGVVGPESPGGIGNLAGVPKLAFADPERSEAGMSMLLATLAPDVEAGWQWWQQRAQRGLLLTEEDADAGAAVAAGTATHALTLEAAGTPVGGLAPLPHTIGLGANSRNVDAARQLLDWLNGPDAAGSLRYSAWTASTNGIQQLIASAPTLDIDWGRQQYVAARKRWAQSGFGPGPVQ